MRLLREWAGPDGWVGGGRHRAFQLGAGRGGTGDKGQPGRKVGGQEWVRASKKRWGVNFVFLMPKTKDTPNRSFRRKFVLASLLRHDLGLGSRAGSLALLD